MFSFFPLGAVCSFYPLVTRCKASCTTVVINDTGVVNVLILLGNISPLSVSFSLQLFLNPPPQPSLHRHPSVLFWCTVCSASAEKDLFLLSPILPIDKMILIRDQDTVELQKLHFLIPPGTLNHFLLLKKIKIKQPKNSHQHGSALQHLFHLIGWPFQMLSMSR